MKKIFNKLTGCSFILAAALLISSCANYSVFNGGAAGLIVDAESTTTPKAGIANVDVYAFTSIADRNINYNAWLEGTIFKPSTTYYGHTTTDVNGSFSISNIIWKEENPDFGKDGDSTMIFLLYYHENYGLSMDQTVITSDSTNNTVYAELKAVKKTTALNINIYDVATSALTTNDVLVSVSVPQTTDTNTLAKAKVYKQTITGNGTMYISYPRWKNNEDKINEIENTPQVTITYFQSADSINWKACANGNNDAQDYSFLADNFEIRKTISNSVYNISLYGKSTRISVPEIHGTYGDISSAASDGKIISMKAKDSSGNFTIDCGETSTSAQTLGTSGSQTHGNFSGLGSGYYITDSSYTEKYKTIEVQFYADGTATGSPRTFRCDQATYNVTLN